MGGSSSVVLLLLRVFASADEVPLVRDMRIKGACSLSELFRRLPASDEAGLVYSGGGWFGACKPKPTIGCTVVAPIDPAAAAVAALLGSPPSSLGTS